MAHSTAHSDDGFPRVASPRPGERDDANETNRRARRPPVETPVRCGYA
jgi:hypothetical protein